MAGGDTVIVALLEILNSITVLVLLALGLAVIFGMMRIVNLAQGEFFTIGAFTTLAAVRFGHLPFWVGMFEVDWMLSPDISQADGVACVTLWW